MTIWFILFNKRALPISIMYAYIGHLIPIFLVLTAISVRQYFHLRKWRFFSSYLLILMLLKSNFEFSISFSFVILVSSFCFFFFIFFNIFNFFIFFHSDCTFIFSILWYFILFSVFLYLLNILGLQYFFCSLQIFPCII